jgi:ribokinase
MTVLVVGDIVTDILALHDGPLANGSDTAARVRISGGGSAANTAAWLASLHSSVALAGVVGDDEPGGARLAELGALGVKCAVRRASDATTGSVVVLSAGDERTMLCDRAANALLTPSDVDVALGAVGAARHLHLSGYVLFDEASARAGQHAIAAAKGMGMTTSVDAASAAPLARLGSEHFFSLVRGADVLFANLDEARVLTGLSSGPEKLATAILPYAATVVVKCGADGAIWAGAGGVVVSSPASPASTVVDPTGAGDAFAAGYLAAWLAGGTPAEALAAGARLGALAVSRFGGRP